MKTSQARSHAERAITLVNLPLDMQVDLIGYHAQRFDTDWLRSALDDGHFDVASEGGDPFALKKFAATTRFLRDSVATAMTMDPEFGRLERPVVHLTATPKPEKNESFPTFYAELVAHVVDQVQMLKNAHLEQGISTGYDHLGMKKFWTDLSVKDAFANGMAACAVLDLPESVRLLAAEEPKAAHVFLKVPETLGEGAMKWDCSGFAHETPAELTPYAIAMAFSKTQTMDVLVNAGFDVRSIAKTVRGDAKDNVPQIDEFNILAFWRQAPVMGLPTAIAKALEHRKQVVLGVHDADFLAHLACEALEPRVGTNRLHSYCDAFHSVGSFEINPLLTLSSAVQSGNANEIKRLQGNVKWPSFESYAGYETSHFVMKAMANAVGNSSSKDNYEDALMAVIERATADGKFDFVLGSIPVKTHEPIDLFKKEKHDVVRMQPVAAIIGNDFSRAIVKMMDQGLDVRHSLAEGALPLIDYAEKQGAQNVVNAMRAHLARTTAHSLLDEMDDSPAPKATP